jgi:hypothetical protein
VLDVQPDETRQPIACELDRGHHTIKPRPPSDENVRAATASDTRAREIAGLRLTLGVQFGSATMDNEVTDATIEILRRLQASVTGMRDELRAGFAATDQRFDAVDARVDLTNARIEALAEMTTARFTTVETVLMDLSARTHLGARQAQTAGTRYERELAELRLRVTRLEEDA